MTRSFSPINFSASQVDSLHGLRAIAVLLVFLDHAATRNHLIHYYFNFVGIGKSGVYLFFLLSSFLLSDGLLKNGFTWSYFFKRFIRIAPLYYFTLIIVAIIQYFNNGPWHDVVYVNDGINGFLKHIIFLKGDFLLWTIPVEVRSYLILPFFVLLLKMSKIFTIIVGSVFSILYFTSFYMNEVQSEPFMILKLAPMLGYLNFYDVFIVGSFIALFRYKTIILDFFKLKYLGLSLLFFILLLTWAGMGRQFLCWELSSLYVYWASLPFALLWTLIILCILSGNSLLNRILQFKVLVEIGKTSYSWYLLHLFVFAFVNAALPEHISWGGAKLIISSFISYYLFRLTYKYIEKPFMKLASHKRKS